MPDVGDVLLDRYELTALIGRGGFGAVFAGRDRVLGREVAIKVVEVSTREDAERFLREARMVAALESEHVVRLFEAGEDATRTPFLVMERLHGMPLDAFLRQRGGRLPVADAVDLVLEVCAALREAHAAGIVHRDIKPQNLFLADRRDGTRRLKVLDFGIAKWNQSPVLTGDQVTMGTLRYMAPEQVEDARSADGRADIWALGVVLYQMLAGSLPFSAGSDAAFAALVLVDEPTPLRTKEPGVPEALAAAVERCLRRRPEERHRSVVDFAASIAPFGSPAGGHLAHDATPAVTAPASAPAASRRIFVATAATVVCGGALAFAWFLWPERRASTLREFALSLPEPAEGGAPDQPVDADASSPAVPVQAKTPQRPPPPRKPSAASPSSAVIDSPSTFPRFVGPCMSNGRSVPAFLVQPGPLRYLCEQLAEDGCGGIAAKCAARGTEERARCKEFLESMRREGGCS